MPSGRLEAQQPEQTFDPNMPTPITDDQLFVHAKHVKDKVVVTTGAVQVTRLNELTHTLFQSQAPRAALGEKPC